VPLFLSSQILEVMQALRADNKGGDDHGGIVQFYERTAGTQVRTSDSEERA
jgi:2-hydroxy-3-oxopropionate reductase